MGKNRYDFKIKRNFKKIYYEKNLVFLLILKLWIFDEIVFVTYLNISLSNLIF